MYYYYQVEGGEETWQAVPAKMRAALEAEKKPRYFSVLAVSKMLESVEPEERDHLKYEGPLYFDWDGEDNEEVTAAAFRLLAGLEEKGLNIGAVALYATGGRGYHCEIPMACFMEKPAPTQYLPAIYKEVALELAVDTLDLRVYSGKRGRMWRAPNVQRENKRYKVPITWAELKSMTPERYIDITSMPRPQPVLEAPKQCLALTIIYDNAAAQIKSKLSRRKKKPVDNAMIRQMSLPSVKAMMEGRGIKADIGFHQLSLQLGILADTMGWSEQELVERAQGLIEDHQSDSNRYNTPKKRSEELVRMHRYTADNPCYEFSIGAIKTLLTHEAPDLDGIPISAEEVEENIDKAGDEPLPEMNGTPVLDAYNDVATGLVMSKYGIYVDTDFGKKRICALSFDDVEILRDAATGTVSCYSAEVLINGKSVGRQTLELETFSGLQAFNRYASRMAHVMQGQDHHVRSLMLRVAQKAMQNNRVKYVAKREGLDVINIPGHENPELHKPFLIWADAKGVTAEPRVTETGVQLSFQGFPDPRGTYRTDLTDAPLLADWVETPAKEQFRKALHAFIGCQRPDVIGNFLGWYTATFYRMMFNKLYEKFPLLHVNGHAGAGKTEMNRAMLSMFYYNQTPKEVTPQSSLFSIQQHLAGSASIPLMVDEYKPNEMSLELHNRLKLMWRDAYNNREISKGGGNRESDDFRSLNLTQISAPIVFIAEAMEEEPATMERVVMVSVVRPPASVAMQWHAKFQEFQAQKQNLAVIGQFIAASIVQDYSLDRLRQEFDAMYSAAQANYMLTSKDLEAGLPEEELRKKQGAKQRTVFNFTVSHFGLRKFREVIEMVYGPEEFAEQFAALESAIYVKMSDLLPATQAEYLKVINTFAAMSYEDPETPSALVHKVHYAFTSIGGKDVIEFAMRACYHRYRVHCRNISVKPLFTGEPAFMHAMRDSTALLERAPTGHKMSAPGGTYVFNMDELRKMGVDDFKS